MKNTRLARVASTLSLAVALTGLAACGSSSDDSAKGGLDLIKAGTLTVCSDVPYAPFEKPDAKAPSGYSGFDMDIIQHIADGLHLKLAVTKQAFDSIKSGLALNAGTCDLAVSALSIKPEREKVMTFSDGYFDSDQSLLVPAGSDIKDIGDLAGKKLAVQKATTGETYARDNAKGAEIDSFPGDAEEFQALKAGQADAILQDLGVNVLHAADGKYKVVETYATDEEYGFAAKKGNDELIDAINAQLKTMKSDGSYDKIYASYFPDK